MKTAQDYARDAKRYSRISRTLAIIALICAFISIAINIWSN